MTIAETYWQLKKLPLNLSPADIQELLTFITGQESWTELVANWNEKSIASQRYQKILQQLNQGLPVAYITQHKVFYGLDFYVDQRVLIPRPETETVIELAQKWLVQHPTARVLDLGCGSGMIGLTLKKNFPQAEIYLSDISKSALKIAQINARQHQLVVNYLLGDFLTPAISKNLTFDLIVCNPPYIDQTDEDLGTTTKFEPDLALIAPEEGLYFYRQMLQQLSQVAKKQGGFCLIMEFGWKQKPQLEVLTAKYLPADQWLIQFEKDYSDNWRCIIINSIN